MKKLLTIFFLLVSVNGFSQQQIFATIAGGDLYSFDLTNCTRHFIGSTGQGFGDIAFTPDGRLWGIAGGQLYQIDTATANPTLIGFTGVQSISLVALNGSILLADYGMNLYGINNNNATSYYIDSIGYSAAGDLTWYDDDLYIVTAGGQIIRIVLNGANTSIQSITPIGLSIPTCEGAVTASFPGSFNSIVGFNGPNLIKICQLDGSTQILCPGLNAVGTPGAASIRLATQIIKPAVCYDPNNVADINAKKFDFNIFPNPASGELNIHTSNNQKFNFVIYNLLGEKMNSGIIENITTIIYIRNLTTGFYNI